LQRTADAGALAGVTGLIPYTGFAPGTPNWMGGQTAANIIIGIEQNKVDTPIITPTAIVDYGYWYLKAPTGTTQALPQARPTTAAWLPEPAIKVTLSKDVTMYLAPLIGFAGPLKATATAIAILPEVYGVTGVPPMAVSEDTVYNIGDDNVTFVVDTTDQDIKIQSNKGIAGWINLDITGHDNSVPSVKIDGPLFADPTGVMTGSQVHLVPGTKATLMDYITAGSTILVAVIANGFNQGDVVPIISWAMYVVDSVDANSMMGHFKDIGYLPGQKPDERPSGYPNTPLWDTPKLVSP
jgi:hypothetical protein